LCSKSHVDHHQRETTDAPVRQVAAILIVMNFSLVISTAPTLLSANSGAWSTIWVALVALLYLALLGLFVLDAILPDGLAWLRNHPPTGVHRSGDMA
jgi:hypothetical protein